MALPGAALTFIAVMMTGSVFSSLGGNSEAPLGLSIDSLWSFYFSLEQNQPKRGNLMTYPVTCTLNERLSIFLVQLPSSAKATCQIKQFITSDCDGRESHQIPAWIGAVCAWLVIECGLSPCLPSAKPKLSLLHSLRGERGGGAV